MPNPLLSRPLAICCLAACCACIPAPGRGQETKVASGEPAAHAPSLPDAGVGKGEDARDNRVGIQLLRNIARDQRAIWTSPAQLRQGHATWLVPFAGISAGFIVTDRDAGLHLGNSTTRQKHFAAASNDGLAGLVGAGGGLWLWGMASGNVKQQQAGILSGEGAVDAVVVSTVLQYSIGRERPGTDASRGRFFHGGNSFPSNHAATAWAIASVLAHEYPGPLTKFLAYGAASGISAARVEGGRHFPADVFVGSGIGWLVGWQVYRAHHRADLAGGVAEDLSDAPLAPTDRRASAMGSPYLPLDSPIYPLLERLLAVGPASDAILGQRPWTRLECARLVSEAGDALQDAGESSQAAKIYNELSEEFAPELRLLAGGENRSLRVESIYARGTEIAGPPLTDGYHFGQTVFNDFGRPFDRGFNSVAGFSGYGTAGRWVVYARGEYQHAPGAPAIAQATADAIAAADLNIARVPQATPVRNLARLLDAYVGLNLGNWQLSYGQESQWWGPGESGSLLFTDNAAPLQMFHIDSVSPFRLPSFLGFLGPMRWNAFFGRLQGHQISPNPFFHGEKISFKPTPNLELGFTRTVVVGGGGRPFTLDRLLRTYFNASSHLEKFPGTDPGKRDGGFDFSYRVPYLRSWLTIYNDAISADDVSPLAAPRRAGINPGFYLTHFPKMAKLDLRVEAPLTDPVSQRVQGRFIYWDDFYHDLYTNRGVLMGNAIGRDAAGIQAQSRYWFTPKDFLQFGYRHAKIDQAFIPQGGTVNDASIRAEVWVRQSWQTSVFVQYEQWKFPLLAPGLQRNVTSSVQLTYFPHSH